MVASRIIWEVAEVLAEFVEALTKPVGRIILCGTLRLAVLRAVKVFWRSIEGLGVPVDGLE